MGPEVTVVDQPPHDPDGGRHGDVGNEVQRPVQGCETQAGTLDQGRENDRDGNPQQHDDRIDQRIEDRLRNSGIREHPNVVVQADELGSAEDSPLGEAVVERLDDRPKVENADARNGRHHEQPWPPAIRLGFSFAAIPCCLGGTAALGSRRQGLGFHDSLASAAFIWLARSLATSATGLVPANACGSKVFSSSFQAAVFADAG